MKKATLILAVLVLAIQSFAIDMAYLSTKKRMGHGRALAKECLGGDKLELFTEDKLSELTRRLKEFDAVILQIYFEKGDWTAFGDALRGWVEAGGVLIATGAECQVVITKIYGQFGQDWKLSRKSCIMGSDQQKILLYSLGKAPDPVFLFPYDVTAAFTQSTGWAHYTEVSPRWSVISRCPKNHPSVLKRDLGKGIVYSMVNHSPNILTGKYKEWYRLIKNAVIQKRLSSAGIRIADSSLSSSYGRQKMVLKFQNEKPLTLHSSISLGDRKLKSRTVQLPRDGVLSLPYRISAPGLLDFHLVFEGPSDNTEISFQQQVVLPLILRPGFHSYRPAILKAAPFRLDIDPAYRSTGKYRFLMNGKEIPGVKFAGFPRPTVADISSLAPGQHRAQVVMDLNGKEFFRTPELTFTVDAENPPLMVDADGFLTRHGKRIFPIGFYTHRPVTGGCAYLMKNGINMISGDYWQPKKYPVTDGILKDAVAQKMLSIYCGYPYVLRKKTKSVPLDQLILAFGDEPDLWGKSPEDVYQSNLTLKKISPQTPTFMCFCLFQSLDGRFNGTCDLMANDSYPVPQGNLSDTYLSFNKLVDSLKGWCRTPVGVPQCFGYPDYKNSWWPALPTVADFYNLYFQSLAAGVKGLHFYVWKDGGFDLEKYPDLLKAVLDFVSWVRNHENFLLSSSQSGLKDANENVAARQWRSSDGQKMKIYVNLTREPAKAFGMDFKPMEVKISIDDKWSFFNH